MVNITEFEGSSSSDENIVKGVVSSSVKNVDEVVVPDGEDFVLGSGEVLLCISSGGVLHALILIHRRGMENDSPDAFLITVMFPYLRLLLPPPPARLAVWNYGVTYIVPAELGSWEELAAAIYHYWYDNVYPESIDRSDVFSDNFHGDVFGPEINIDQGLNVLASGVTPIQCWPCSILLFGGIFHPHHSPLPFLLLNWDFYNYIDVREFINTLIAIELCSIV